MLSTPPVTICALTYGNYPDLVKRCIQSILLHCERSLYRLAVGANQVGDETQDYLKRLRAEGRIDRLCESATNIHKCPMMRRMITGIDTEYLWWFDDDSHIIDPEALTRRLAISRGSPASMGAWGHRFYVNSDFDFGGGPDPVDFVKSATWYRGKEPPSCRPGGKGEFNFEGRGVGDGRWFFPTGGCWFARTAAIRDIDWPDRRLRQHGPDDVMLGEALRQCGWEDMDVGPLGVAVSDHGRRAGIYTLDSGPEAAAD